MVVVPGCADSLLLLMCWCCFLLGAVSFPGNLPPPENLSLSWDPSTDPSSLSFHIQWREPAGLNTECTVNYIIAIYYEQNCPPKQNASDKRRIEKLNFKYSMTKEDRICVGITTNPMGCGNKNASKEVYKYLPPPLALVKNFNCAYYANKMMNCTWTIVQNTPDLQLLYQSLSEDKKIKKINHCMSYITKDSMKTGCHLHDEDLVPNAKVYFAIRVTGENDLINKFEIDMRESVKPLKPKVYITQKDDRLHFQISTPDFLAPHCWKYGFKYSKCNGEPKESTSESSSTIVDYDTACQYTVQGKVIYSNYCGKDQDIESDMSEPKYYGEDVDPNLAFKIAIIITPLIVCCCLIAAIVLFRRNKDLILPKIPDPSLFFKDMLNNTSDGISKSMAGGKLYEPVKEVVASVVSMEPKCELLHPNHDTCT